jgi:hypothetical protein
LMLPRKGMRQESNDYLCAWLWQHCAKCVVVNSTMLFGALFAGKPVAMLGRGWATGNNVVQECGSMAEAFEDYEPDAERVKLFLALILSRCRSHEELRCHHNTKKTFEFLDALRGDYVHFAERAPPIIKTIYIDNQDKLKTVKYCLEWTIKKNPESRVILAIDQAPPEFEQWACGLSLRVECVSFPEKRPRGGRMSLLMGLALKRIMPQEKIVITAEQDTIFSELIVPKLKELLEQGGPKTAAIQAESCLFGGKRCYPSFHVPERHRVSGGADIDEKTIETNHATFSTTIWRTQALREVDWTKTRVHSGADLDAANQIKVNGWKFYQTFHVKAIHQSHTIVRDGFGIINHLKNKHKGLTCYIIGKGPSLDAVTAETFERGCPIICLNESIHNIEALGIDNPMYVIQQDKALKESCKPSNEKTTILLAGLCERLYQKYQRRIVHRPEYFDVKPKGHWPHSSLMAVKYARLFGCKELRMVGFDQLTNGNDSYADSLKDKTLIPTSLNLRINNELLIDEIGNFPATWLGNNGNGFIGLSQDVQRDNNAFANIVQDGAWKGRRCFIVGGGPSLEGFDWSLLDGELVIAANRAFESCNPNIIVSCDPVFTRWVKREQDDGNGLCSPESMQHFRDLKCLRAIVKVNKSNYSPGLNFLRFAGNDGFSSTLSDGVVCGRNSGFAALNLAVLLGASQIYLLGFDMQYRPSDNRAHYYDKGKPWKRQDPYRHYKHYYDKVAPEIKARGQQVINLSLNSALECFEKAEFPAPNDRPVYVSCYTVNSPYVKEIDKLITSLIQFGLPYDLWPYESFGSHFGNCSYISTVCREAVEKYPNRPVVFLPADAIVRCWPEVLEKMPGNIDFAAPYFKFSPSQKRKELNSSCLYFAPTATARNLTREWERRCKLDRQQRDQNVLRDIIDEDKWGGEWLNLPGEYCRIFDNTVQPGAENPPVIELFMASRRFRNWTNKKEKINAS